MIIKKYFLLLFLLLSISLVSGEKLSFSGFVLENGIFKIENIEHRLNIGNDLETVSIQSPFVLIIVKEGNCKSMGYYTYCIESIEEKGTYPLHTNAKIKLK